MNILEIYNKYNNFGRFFDMHYKVIEAGHIEYYMEVKEDLIATKNAMHGGALSAFMDGVAGIAALSAVVDEGRLVSTIEFKINYLQPVYLGDKLKGIGKVLRKGKRVIFSEGKIYNQNNELIATASGTFNSYPFQKSDMF